MLCTEHFSALPGPALIFRAPFEREREHTFIKAFFLNDSW